MLCMDDGVCTLTYEEYAALSDYEHECRLRSEFARVPGEANVSLVDDDDE